jgi:DnaJ-class molecular chaperone
VTIENWEDRYRSGGYRSTGTTTRQDFVDEAREAFGAWVKKFEVEKVYPIDQFESSNFELNHVWTEIWDDGGWIVAEYLHHSENTKGVVIGYYVSKQPWGIEAGKEIGISTSLLFPCKDCSEEGEEGFVNNECHSCGGEGDFFEFDISR